MFHDVRHLPWSHLDTKSIHNAASQVAALGNILYWSKKEEEGATLFFCIPQRRLESLVAKVHPNFCNNIRRMVRHEAGGFKDLKRIIHADEALAVAIEFTHTEDGAVSASIHGATANNWDIWMTARTLFEAVLARLGIVFSERISDAA